MIGRVLEIRRYPVKSLVGERLTSADLGVEGVPGDRGWGIIDADGVVLTGRRWPQLLQARATLSGDRTSISLPNGVTFDAGDPAGDGLLSAWLEHPVRLRRPAPGGRPRIAGSDDVYEGREGSFFDAAPVHVVTTATLRYLTSLYPEGAFDPRRFRANVVIEADGEEPIEQTWIGRDLTVGGAGLSIAGPCRRCVMTTMPQEDLPLDRGILRTVTTMADRTVGVYAQVPVAGPVRVGDAVSFA